MIRGHGCGRYRDALAGLAERDEPTAAGRAALDHVGDCRACADTLGELMLTAYALRRMGTEATIRFVDERDDAWTRLRARVERSGRLAREQAWRWRTTLGGLATGVMLVAALVGPAAIHVNTDVAAGETIGNPSLRIERLDLQTELDYLSAARRAVDAGTTAGPTVLDSAAPPRTMYPDGIRPERKEVQPGRANMRLPEAG